MWFDRLAVVLWWFIELNRRPKVFQEVLADLKNTNRNKCRLKQFDSFFGKFRLKYKQTNMQTCEKTNVHFQWSFSESDNEERQAPIIQALKKTTSAPGAIGPGAFQRAWLLACCCWHLADQMMSTEIQISMRKMIKQDGWSTGDNYFHWRPLSVLFI